MRKILDRCGVVVCLRRNILTEDKQGRQDKASRRVALYGELVH